MASPVVRKEIYSVDCVLSKILPYGNGFGEPRACHDVDFDGDPINLCTARMKLFVNHGTKCVGCGLRGVFFAKEKHIEHADNLQVCWRLNLYGFDQEGKEVLMTRDHIIPKSLGGVQHASNFQVMCFNCNAKKGNKVDESLLNRRHKRQTEMEIKLQEAGII